MVCVGLYWFDVYECEYLCDGFVVGLDCWCFLCDDFEFFGIFVVVVVVVVEDVFGDVFVDVLCWFGWDFLWVKCVEVLFGW